MRCEDCRYANWDASLFKDRTEGHWDGAHYIPPYSEQFDVCCTKNMKFFLEENTPLDCKEGEQGENNYHEVCKEHYRQIREYITELKKNKKQLYARTIE